MTDDLRFDCPRCGHSASAFTYGPCADCRAQLRGVVHGEKRDVTAGRYQPNMHVVPNHVATKD